MKKTRISCFWRETILTSRVPECEHVHARAVMKVPSAKRRFRPRRMQDRKRNGRFFRRLRVISLARVAKCSFRVIADTRAPRLAFQHSRSRSVMKSLQSPRFRGAETCAEFWVHHRYSVFLFPSDKQTSFNGCRSNKSCTIVKRYLHCAYVKFDIAFTL